MPWPMIISIIALVLRAQKCHRFSTTTPAAFNEQTDRLLTSKMMSTAPTDRRLTSKMMSTTSPRRPETLETGDVHTRVRRTRKADAEEAAELLHQWSHHQQQSFLLGRCILPNCSSCFCHTEFFDTKCWLACEPSQESQSSQHFRASNAGWPTQNLPPHPTSQHFPFSHAF